MPKTKCYKEYEEQRDKMIASNDLLLDAFVESLEESSLSEKTIRKYCITIMTRSPVAATNRFLL